MLYTPLYSFLIIYLLVVIGYGIFLAIIMYHLVASASFSIVTLFMTLFTLIFIAGNLILTFYLLRDVSWSTLIFLFDVSTIKSLFSP